MQLIKVRIQADSQLRIALESAPNPEVRARLARILKFQIERPPQDQVKARRWMRLMFALELIDSSQSESLLRQIADGHKDIDISREAASALLRNAARKRLRADVSPDDASAG